MKQTLTILAYGLLITCFSFSGFAQTDPLPDFFNGITLDDARSLLRDDPSSVKQRDALERLPTRTIVRVVFDANTEPGRYTDALNYLRSLKLPDGRRKIFIMGELVDSDFLAHYRWECKPSEGCTVGEEGESFHDYKARVNSYLTVLDKPVDIWEVGNEVNGEWADEGCIKKVNRDGSDGGCFSDVKEEKDEKGNRNRSNPNPLFTARKIKYAIDEAANKHKAIALTLIHQPECTTWDKNTMFEWANTNLKPLIDGDKINYLLISYYEDNCDQGKKTIAPKRILTLTKDEKRSLSEDDKEQRRRDIYWTQTFKDLSDLFSHVEHVGFGEVGYSSDMKTCEVGDVMSFCSGGKGTPSGSKGVLLDRYYGMTVTNSKYVGGHFWWTAQEDITYGAFYEKLASYFKKHK